MEAQQAFAGLESDLDITVGKLNFFVDKDGVQDLLDPLDKEALDAEILDNASTETPSILAATSSQIVPIQSPSDSATSMNSQEFRDEVAKDLEEARSNLRTTQTTQSSHSTTSSTPTTPRETKRT